jgi:hypothetical protein
MASISAQKYIKLAAKQNKRTKNISEGKYASVLFDGGAESAAIKTLKERLSNLDYLIDDTNEPKFIKSWDMKELSCISFNTDLQFNKKNPKVKPKDVWWTHLYGEYDVDGECVKHNVFAISGCYLDRKTIKINN